MAVSNYLPLALVLGLVAASFLPVFSARVSRLYSKLALLAFGRYLSLQGDRPDLERLLQSAYMGVPFRVYAAKTLFYSTIAAIAGSILGVYLASGLLTLIVALASGDALRAIPIPPDVQQALRSIPELSFGELLGLLLLSSATVGVGSWVITYQVRWWIPELRADTRRRDIELSTPRTIAFMYALSRGGLEIPRILRLLGRHRAIYGEAAKEMAVAGKAIDVFGMDTVSAIHHISRRTPSDQFRIFTENLASVLQSGRNIPDFLSDQYEQYQEEAEVQQDLFLDRLGAIAEGYVALFVVGPLFLITVLLVFGLISGGTQSAMETIIYLLVPLLNLGFIYYLSHTTQPLDVPDVELGDQADVSTPTIGTTAADPGGRPVVSDGGTNQRVDARLAANLDRIAIYDRFQPIRVAARNPIASITSNPQLVLYGVVPLALVWLGFGMWTLHAQESLTLTALDEFILQSLLIVFAPYAVARHFYTNRLREIERVVPDLFNRLASLNESGIEIVNAFKEVRSGNLGILTPELDRIWKDIEYGLNVEQALYRFEDRSQSPSISRAVTLITNGMKASGNIGPVLRIAADESRRINALKRKRETDMSIYLVIIYLSFLVFLTIIFVLVETFIPAIPTRASLEGSGLAGAAAGITPEQAAAFTTLLFHASLIQATFSGLIAGQMSHGSIRDGAIHVVILLILAYILFSIIG